MQFRCLGRNFHSGGFASASCLAALLLASSSDAQQPPLWIGVPTEYAEMDQLGNNLQHPERGATDALLLRLSPASYADGSGLPSGANRPSARAISNAVAAQTQSIPNTFSGADLFWLWGQFLDHDLDATQTGSDSFDVQVPTGDPFFDPDGQGNVTISLHRSVFETVAGVRQHPNSITSYIDASNVYGSDEARTLALRKLDGSGELKTSEGDLLPFNLDGLPNAGGTSPELFVAGDERSNEHCYLTAMHTLWMREHNYWARFMKSREPWRTGDEAFYWARAIVAAEQQAITYGEFLPVLLGPDAFPKYAGYDAGVDATISQEFGVAAYRLGHSLLNNVLLRLDVSGNPIPQGPIELQNAFFNPTVLVESGIAPLLLGVAGQPAQELDSMIVDAVRNFLFAPEGQVGLDLASLNIQRGRDHGVADYNTVRSSLGLAPAQSFADISSNKTVQARLADAYGSVADMDLWITGLAEDRVPGSILGETFHAIVTDQFRRLRDGDRFWYERALPPELVILARHTKLSTVIARNTEISVYDIQHEAMLLPTAQAADPVFGFESLSAWSSPNANLSLNTQLCTDGQSSLDVAGQGFLEITSQPFPAATLSGGDRLLADVFVPEDQREPMWAGQVLAFLDCPAAGLWFQHVGTVELTDMPREQFNTLEMGLGSVASALSSHPSALCELSLALNVNATTPPYAVDRLRVR